MTRQSVSEKAPLVLMVDSDADTRTMYGEFLSYSGFRVEQASEAQEAREKARLLRPAIITTEVGLADGADDRDLCEWLKVDEETRTIPVVVVTAWVGERHVERARRAGCDTVLFKPCSPATLVSEIRKLLH